MVKILVKENRSEDNIIMSYDEQLNGMIGYNEKGKSVSSTDNVIQ